MKKIILGSVALLMAVAAFADVPRGRPRENNPVSYINNFDGLAAEVLYSSANVAEKRMNTLRSVRVTYYKVLRSKSGMFQVVCWKTTDARRAGTNTYSCQTETSANGEKLDKYTPPVPLRRRGG